MIVETKTPVDDVHSWWSGYNGNSLGRVLHYLYCYLGFNYAEDSIYGNNQVTYWGKIIATIDWSRGFPLFTFSNIPTELQQIAESRQSEMLSNLPEGEL